MNGISQAREEITLFDSKGRAAAYISTDDDLTIYMWGGQTGGILGCEEWDLSCVRFQRDSSGSV